MSTIHMYYKQYWNYWNAENLQQNGLRATVKSARNATTEPLKNHHNMPIAKANKLQNLERKHAEGMQTQLWLVKTYRYM